MPSCLPSPSAAGLPPQAAPGSPLLPVTPPEDRLKPSVSPGAPGFAPDIGSPATAPRIPAHGPTQGQRGNHERTAVPDPGLLMEEDDLADAFRTGSAEGFRAVY